MKPRAPGAAIFSRNRGPAYFHVEAAVGRPSLLMLSLNDTFASPTPGLRIGSKAGLMLRMAVAHMPKFAPWTPLLAHQSAEWSRQQLLRVRGSVRT